MTHVANDKSSGPDILEQLPADEWMAPGRKTIQGYLVASRGGFKKNYGLLGDLIAASIDEAKPGVIPRRPDLHAVWWGWNPEKPPHHQAVRPLLRYKSVRPIPGLRTECYGHRVELTCTITERLSNGMGAWITKAEGRCLDCGD